VGVVEVLSHFVAFAGGVIITAITLAWKHRRVIEAVVEWGFKALADGRLTKEEVADLFETLGRRLREEQ
jgi:hypothetical protein